MKNRIVTNLFVSSQLMLAMWVNFSYAQTILPSSTQADVVSISSPNINRPINSHSLSDDITEDASKKKIATVADAIKLPPSDTVLEWDGLNDEVARQTESIETITESAVYFDDNVIIAANKLPFSIFLDDAKTRNSTKIINHVESPPFKYHAELASISTVLATSQQDVGDVLLKKSADYLRSETASYLGSNAQQWLSQYGTANVNIELDEKFAPKLGQVDVLFPITIHTQGDLASTWFVQQGAVFNGKEQYNGRDFIHFGVGYRTQNNHVFYGLNAFYDYDMTRSHHRASVGAEYVRQFISFNANYYFPLSDWIDSEDKFASVGQGILEERPAEGADVNVSAFLPQFPYLSLDATYQQFFGDHVEMSNGNQPVKNPFVVSSSLNYQPVPLLTFGVGYRHEKGGEEGFTFDANLVYRFGLSLSQQLDSSNVRASKSLKAHLFNLVKRDHNIRLAYREKESEVSINFRQNDFLVKERQLIPISQWLDVLGAKASINDVIFEGNAASFIQQDKHFKAPAYQRVGSDVNRNVYNLRISLKLSDGKIVRTPTWARIVVGEDATVNELYDVTITAQSQIDSHGNLSTIGLGENVGFKVAVIIRNAAGDVIPDKALTFTTQTPDANFVRADVISDNNGQAVTVLNSTKAGIVTFQISDKSVIYQGEVVFSSESNTPSSLPGTSALTATPSTITADGHEQANLTLVLKDKDGNLLSGRTVILKGYRNNAELTSGITISTPISSNDGRYRANLTGTSVGNVIVKATVIDASGFEVSSNLITIDGTSFPSPTLSTLQISPTSIIANQRDTAIIRFSLKDNNNTPLINKDVLFTAYRNGAPISDGIIISEVSASGDGHYTASLTGVSHGSLLIKATIKNLQGFEVVSNEITLVENAQPPVVLMSSLTSSVSSLVANGTDTTTFTLLLRDKAGDALVGKNSKFTAYLNGQPVSDGVTLGTVIDHGDGSYSASFASTLSGRFHLVARIEGYSTFSLNSNFIVLTAPVIGKN